MPRNLELKCRIASKAIACECARALGAQPHGVLVQEDTYFVVPHGRLKLREHHPGAAELIVYERPNQKGDRWSNYQRIEVTGSPGLKEALSQALGVACVVRKKRHLFLTSHARIHIDEVEGLGVFLEFEVTNEDAVIAVQKMAELRKSFGLEAEEGIEGSYSDLALNCQLTIDYL
jgi:predicted adenylyl cyclase CyaB